jgi:putative ABC transport system permease protein
MTLIEERSREVWQWPRLESVWADVRFALRAMRRNPAFTATAMLSLALGIGANTAIFSLIDAVILRSLPVQNPNELVQVMVGQQRYDGFSNPVWEQLRDRQDVFSGIFAYGRWGFDLSQGGAERPANGTYVSGSYFDTLGVHPALGRLLKPSDDTRGCAGSVVLSYGFWQAEYGGRADVLGKTISIDRHPIEIVGVAQRGFDGVEVGASPDLMVPLCAAAVIRSSDLDLLDTNYLGVGWLQIMGRLKQGVSAGQANTRLKTLAPGIYQGALDRWGAAREDGQRWRPEELDRYLRGTLDTQPAPNGISWLRREYRQALTVLMATVGLVLLIACANVANLLLARGAARLREIAIRMAVGGGRRRIVRQMLTESLLLSGIGASLGILFAELAERLLVRFLHASLDLALDTRVLAFTVGVAALTGLMFGIAPAWRAASVDPQFAMKVNARGVIQGSKLGVGKVLVTAQMALSMLLAVGAGLMLSTFWKLASLDAGFDRSDVLLVTTDLRSGKYPEERWSAVYLEILQKLRAVPGVASASVSYFTPVCHCRLNSEVEIEGYTPKSRDDAMVAFNNVTDQYFETVGTPIVGGRDFDRNDTPSSPRVAIISQAMARKYFGLRNPLGQHFRIRNGGIPGTPVEVIGIVKDAKYGSLRDDPSPYAFLPWGQGHAFWPLTSFELRAVGGSPSLLIPGVKSAIGAVNPEMSIGLQTLSAKVDDSIKRERLLATLSGVFGVLGLILASIGSYGVMSYSVARRRNEIGIRIALGAKRSRVLGMVLSEIAVLIGIGLSIGFVAALTTTRFISSFLYGLKPNDPLTFLVAAAVLAGVALVAGYLPARRAARLDPMIALREE